MSMSTTKAADKDVLSYQIVFATSINFRALPAILPNFQRHAGVRVRHEHLLYHFITQTACFGLLCWA